MADGGKSREQIKAKTKDLETQFPLSWFKNIEYPLIL
jgi:hypothetical protein